MYWWLVECPYMIVLYLSKDPDHKLKLPDISAYTEASHVRMLMSVSCGIFNCFAYLKWFVSLSCWCIVQLFIQLSPAAPNSVRTHNGLSQIHPNTNYYCNIIKSDIINGSSNMWVWPMIMIYSFSVLLFCIIHVSQLFFFLIKIWK